MIRALVLLAVLTATARAEADPCDGEDGVELATCREDHDQLATAWRLWRELKDRARADGDTRLAKTATEHITAIQPRLAYLTLALPKGDAPPTGLAIRVDGEPFDLDDLGSSTAIDRGEHRIDAAAPGYAQWTRTLTIENGAFKTVEVGPLVPASDAPPADPDEEAVFEEDRPPPPPPPPPAKQKWGGLVTAIVGGVVTGVGLWAGLDAMGKRDDARALGCNADLSSCPSGAAFDAASAAHGRANLSTALTLGGLVLGAGGLVLWTTGTF